MTARNYSNTASDAELSALVGSGATSFSVIALTGYPTQPFIAALDPDTSDEEIILVTGVSGTTLTATRGYDGTSAKAHQAGGVLRHVASAKDFQEANDHVNASSGVHGATGSVVGTTDTQTLTNKTLTAPTISNPTLTGTATGASADFSGSVQGGSLASDGSLAVGTTATVTGALTAGSLNTAGAVTAASAALSGNATVGGTLDVDGAATVDGALSVAGATTLTGGVSGAVAATGALSGTTVTATGAVSGTTITGSGLVKGAGLESTAALALAQIAAPSGTASKDTVYAKTDGGVYVKAGTGSEARLSRHWGSGTSVPSSGMLAGDTYDHDTAGVLIYNGSAWQPTLQNVWYKPNGLSEVGGASAAPPRFYMGHYTAVFSASSFVVTSISYASAGFTEKPVLFAMTDDGSSFSLSCTTDDVITTGATIVVRSAAQPVVNFTANVPVMWIAVGR